MNFLIICENELILQEIKESVNELFEKLEKRSGLTSLKNSINIFFETSYEKTETKYDGTCFLCAIPYTLYKVDEKNVIIDEKFHVDENEKEYMKYHLLFKILYVIRKENISKEPSTLLRHMYNYFVLFPVCLDYIDDEIKDIKSFIDIIEYCDGLAMDKEQSRQFQIFLKASLQFDNPTDSEYYITSNELRQKVQNLIKDL